jgi:hypothetical protein
MTNLHRRLRLPSLQHNIVGTSALRPNITMHLSRHRKLVPVGGSYLRPGDGERWPVPVQICINSELGLW